MVLVISSSKKKAQVISDIFYYMGIPSYATTATEALSEISATYRAVLICDPENLADAESYVARLRQYTLAAPIFAISENGRQGGAIFDGSFSEPIYSSTLLEEIVRYQSERDLPTCAHYRLAGIDASCTSERVTVFDKAIPLTKTETMILRYLIASYPSLQSATKIVKYAYGPYKRPEASSIRTHISVMNRKFREITGKNLCTAIEKEGYVISTPEMLKRIAASVAEI